MKTKKVRKLLKEHSKEITSLKEENKKLLYLLESISSALCIKDETCDCDCNSVLKDTEPVTPSCEDNESDNAETKSETEN